MKVANLATFSKSNPKHDVTDKSKCQFGTLIQRFGLNIKSEELEPKMQKLRKEIEELSQKREPKMIEHYKDKLTILQYALSQYSCPKEGEDVPESVIEAYFSKIVVKKDGFDWYIRINGDPNKPLHCKLEGKRRSTTKVVVTQDFFPALDSSTTGCH